MDQSSDSQLPSSAKGHGRKWRWRLVGFLVCCFLLFAFYFFRVPLLSGAANAWIVNEPLSKADAIIVLGGGLETRPFEAARLYRQGISATILVLNVRLNETEKLRVMKSETELAREVLLRQGVPEDAITVIGASVSSTREESLAVQNWVREYRPKRIIIPTEMFHTRRVNWLFHKVLRTNEVDIVIDAIKPRDYDDSNWWQHEEGLIAFQNEIIKFGLYLWKY